MDDGRGARRLHYTGPFGKKMSVKNIDGREEEKMYMLAAA